MTMPKVSSALSDETHKMIQAFDALNTDEKLAWFYYVYTKMGSSITPAAPSAAEPELAPTLLGDFYNLSDDEQLAVMREIVEKKDSTLSRAYGGLTEKNQLLVWYAWAVGMGDTVVGMPEGYEAPKAVNDALGEIEGMDFEEQISMFRSIVGNMGYSDVKPIETQAETGKTPSL